MYLDGTALLVESSCNIAKSIHMLLTLLDGWAPTFKETLDWIQFEYTAERTGTYVAPASTSLLSTRCRKEILSLRQSDTNFCADTQELTLLQPLCLDP